MHHDIGPDFARLHSPVVDPDEVDPRGPGDLALPGEGSIFADLRTQRSFHPDVLALVLHHGDDDGTAENLAPKGLRSQFHDSASHLLHLRLDPGHGFDDDADVDTAFGGEQVVSVDLEV